MSFTVFWTYVNGSIPFFASGFYPLTLDFSVASLLLRVLWFTNFQYCLIFRGWIYRLHLSTLLSMDSVACFQFGAITNRELLLFRCSHAHITIGCIPMGRNLGHQIGISLTFIDNAKQLPQTAIATDIPRRSGWEFPLPYPRALCIFLLSLIWIFYFPSIIHIYISLIRWNGLIRQNAILIFLKIIFPNGDIILKILNRSKSLRGKAHRSQLYGLMNCHKVNTPLYVPPRLRERTF